MKKCCTCAEEKPASEFGSLKSSKDGLSKMCKPCSRIAKKESYQKNKVSILASQKVMREQDRPSLRKRQREWYAKSADQRREKQREWYASNKERVLKERREAHAKDPSAQAARTRKWRLENLERFAAKEANRRCAKMQRTPAWLTPEDFEAIEAIYRWAKIQELLTGVAHEVDHEIPLQGDLVSGLHVPGNLRVITASENRSKSNIWHVA